MDVGHDLKNKQLLVLSIGLEIIKHGFEQELTTTR